jgi:hypothetical protein
VRRTHLLTFVLCTITFLPGAALRGSSSRLEAATQAAAPQPSGKPPGKPAPANPPAGTGGKPAPATSPAPDNYTYEPAGRRDPFINLLGTGVEPRLNSKRGGGEGAAGWAVADISVRGIVQASGSLLAMVRGPDGRTFLVHPGDRFLDGTVKTITPQGLIISQEVNDPLSLIKQREIRKQLRSTEDTKP